MHIERYSKLVVLAAISILVSTESTKSNVLAPVVIPFPKQNENFFLNVTEFVYTSPTTNPPRKAYWIHTNHHYSIVTPPPTTEPDRLFFLWKTSHQAQYFGCDVAAVNGGPFHADGTSCGPLVVEGKLIQNVSSDWVGIGVTDQEEWVLGAYHQIANDNQSFLPNLHGRIQSFVTGFHWLVYNGTVVTKGTDYDNRQIDVKRAARTAVGVADDGTMVLLVVDGCEKWYENASTGTGTWLLEVFLYLTKLLAPTTFIPSVFETRVSLSKNLPNSSTNIQAFASPSTWMEGGLLL